VFVCILELKYLTVDKFCQPFKELGKKVKCENHFSFRKCVFSFMLTI